LGVDPLDDNILVCKHFTTKQVPAVMLGLLKAIVVSVLNYPSFPCKWESIPFKKLTLKWILDFRRMTSRDSFIL